MTTPNNTSHQIEQAPQKRSESKFTNQIIIILIFVLLESIGGYLSQSLAIYCDIGHLMSDLAGYSISLYAIKFSQRVSDKKYTYGFKKVENIGALFSVFFTWIICIFIMVQGFVRLWRIYRHEKIEIDAYFMVLSSFLSLGINVIMMFALTHDHDHDHDHFGFHSHHSHSHSHSLISTNNDNDNSIELKAENHNELLIQTEQDETNTKKVTKKKKERIII